MDPFQPQAQGIPGQPVPQQPVIPQPMPPQQPVMPQPMPQGPSLDDLIRQTAGVAPQVQAKMNPPVSGSGGEKIIYKKQRVHGFFRTLTIIALVLVGFLMLAETMKVFSLYIGGVSLSQYYPFFVILSAIVIWSYRGIFGKLFGVLLFLGVVVGFFGINVYTGLYPSSSLISGTDLHYPSLSGATYTKLYISSLVSDISGSITSGNNLLQGKVIGQRAFVGKSALASDNHQYLLLSEDTNWNLLHRNYSSLSLGFSQEVFYYLYMKSFASRQILDLSKVTWRGLYFHDGVTLLDLTLGKNIETGAKIDIQNAFSDITLRLPKSFKITLLYQDKYSLKDMPDFVEKETGVFVAHPDASKELRINVAIGLGRFKIIWLD